MRAGGFISVVRLEIKKNICDSRQSHQGLLKYWGEGKREKGGERQCRELHIIPRKSTHHQTGGQWCLLLAHQIGTQIQV